jgi:cell division ATPase FtsA
MNFLNFFKSKNNFGVKNEYLILDFSQNSIKGLIFEGEKKLIKKFFCEKITPYGVFNGKDFEREVIKKTADKIIKNLGIKNEISKLKTKVTFSPEILKGRVFKITFKRKGGGKKIGKEEQKEIYNKVFWEAREKLSKEIFKNTKARTLQEFQILNQKIIEERISGYKVSSILGFKGTQLSFKVLIIFISKNHLKFLSFLKKIFNFRESDIFHEVEGLIKYFCSSDSFSQVFVDIGKRVSAIFGFKTELEFIDEFQVGGHNFTKALVENLGLPEAEAEILKEQFSKNQLSEKVRKKIEKILKSPLDLWLDSFQKKIKENSRSFSLFPQKILLFGGGSLLPQIKQSIKGSEILDAKNILQNLQSKFWRPSITESKISFSPEAIPSLLLTL